ncbi:DUF2807 domain-containing protein [candidate division KSB1 bacterium]|nr:DUF2807 domain-containing protein [candidate division KSB1 bacterium]
MKSLYIIISLSLLAVAGCEINNPSLTLHDKERIYASGEMLTEERMVADIHSVYMTTAGDVYVSQGHEQRVKVTVNENIMPYIETSVNNGKLYIGIKNSVSISNMDLTVSVTLTSLKALATTSAGTITGTNTFTADQVQLKLSSAGDIRLSLNASELESYLSSAGNLYLEGTVTNHDASLSSAGNLYAFNLITQNTDIKVSSAGNARIYVSKNLDATLTSAGSVYYKGYPSIDQSVSSSGRVINAN